MKISIQWLNEFVQTKGSSDDISDILTMLGLEAESLPDLSDLDDIVIGEVRDCSKHPNADRLNICKVFDGKDELPIVCGAPNVRKGQKIALAPVGAILPGDFKISKAKIRGEISQGMICSEKELGISQEHEGIMVLEDRARPGDSFQEFFNEKNTIELDKDILVIFLKLIDLLNCNAIRNITKKEKYTKNNTLWNPSHISDINIARRGMKKLYLFLKTIPQKIAIDKIGVKFGGWGTILVTAAKITNRAINIILRYFIFIKFNYYS